MEGVGVKQYQKKLEKRQKEIWREVKKDTKTEYS